MKHDELTQIIEAISIDFVLTEPTDSETLRLILSRFRHMLSWPIEHSQPVLEQALNHIIVTMEKELDETNALSGLVYDMVGQSISSIQNHARLDFDFSRAKFPFEIDVLSSEATPPPPSPAITIPHPPRLSEISDKKVSPSEQKSVPPQGLKHPEDLPGHLDLDLFAEYLSLQAPIIDKMESLVLSLDQNQDANALSELKRLLHTQKGEAGFLNLKDVETLCHALEDRLDTDKTIVNTDFLFSSIDWIRNAYNWYKGESATPPLPIDELLKAMSLEKKAPVPGQAYETPLRADDDDEKTGAESRPTVSAKAVSSQIKESILVDTERLDKIINMIGELVIAEAMVLQSDEIKHIQSQDLNRHLAQMDKITRELQETGLSLRMVPIRSIFQKMVRLVRDISKKSGKPIECVMSGEDTELDKTLVDKIGEPLLHIIRNAADHGIEHQREHRIKTGKPEKGTIRIKACHKSGNIHIEIEDDGRGLDKSSIVKKAKKLNLISGEARLSDQDIFNLIFEPGFSTSEEVTGLSGRGVGMSVVKTTIESLRGHVDVRTDEGKGTAFIIKIPLTLAIIDGMLVRSGQDRFIIPTLSIVTSNKIEPEQITNVVNHGELINIQGQLIPLHNLSSLLQSRKQARRDKPPLMVVVESSNRRIALGVDELIGKQQIVIKSLGESMNNIIGISGAAIMADGKVCLIIDVDKIASLSQPQSSPSFSLQKPSSTI